MSKVFFATVGFCFFSAILSGEHEVRAGVSAGGLAVGLDGEEKAKAYLGSDWSEHGLVPYSQCRIVNECEDNPVASGTVGLIAGVTPMEDHQSFYLMCSTGKNESLKIKIPVYFDHIFHLGGIVELMSMGEVRFNVQNLKGKTVDQVFRTYRGVEAGIALFGGIKAGAMRSRPGAWISFEFPNMGFFGVSATYSSLKLEHLGEGFYLYSDNADGTSNESLVENIKDFRFVQTETTNYSQWASENPLAPR